MTTGDQIKYLQHKEIDKAKWDACIEQAPNGLIYGYSFYGYHDRLYKFLRKAYSN